MIISSNNNDYAALDSFEPDVLDDLLADLDQPNPMDDDDIAGITDPPEAERDTRDGGTVDQVDTWLAGLDWGLAVSQGDLPSQAIVDEIDGLRGRVKGHQLKIGRTHQGLIKILADIYALAHRHRHDISPILLALRTYKIKVTAATIANPMLPIIRLVMPSDDRKQQSYCARALCQLAHNGIAPEHAATSIMDAGGVDACAKAWAKRQREAKPRPVAEAKHVDANAPSVSLPASTPAPEADGVYLILARRSSGGAISALGHIVDPRLTARARHHLIPALAIDMTDLP